MTKSTGQRRHYSPQVEAQILILQEQGMKQTDIATQLSVNIAKVRKHLYRNDQTLKPEQRRANVTIGRRSHMDPITQQQIKEIHEYKKQGMKEREIATKVGVTFSQVLVHVRAMDKEERYLTPEQNSDNHRLYSKDLENKAVELRNAGASTATMAQALSIKPSTAAYLTNVKNGIILSPQQRSAIITQANSTISDANKAMILSLRATGMLKKDVALQVQLPLGTVSGFLKDQKHTIDRQAAIRNAAQGRAVNSSKRLLKQYKMDNYPDILTFFANKHNGKCLGSYTHPKTKIPWKCKKGHQFDMLFNGVQQGSWCPSCAHNSPSEAQIEIFNYVNSIYNGKVLLSDRTAITPKELDIYVPDKKFAIEYNGLYWHSNALKNRNGEHVKKYDLCQAAGIELFAIYLDEWENKPELIKAMIRWRLGLFNGTKVPPRKLALVKLKHNVEFKDFFERNHIDGHAQASYALALKLGDKIIQCASFRTNESGCLELARLATDYDYYVPGGAGKLIDQIKEPLISFSDNRLSRSCNVYAKLGFKEITQSKAPGYWYTDGKYTKIWRTSCMLNKDPTILAQYPTEPVQALNGVFSQKFFGDNRPLYRIEDYGNRKWIKNQSNTSTKENSNDNQN
jgi:orotate phosphoribosyltransferase-like protein